VTSVLDEPTTLADWTQHAATLQPREGIYIDGEFRPSDSGATFESVNPATVSYLRRWHRDSRPTSTRRSRRHEKLSTPVIGRAVRSPNANACCCDWPN